MCKKSWKRLKNLAFAVVLGTVLISALTVTAGAVVTEESGNGKALYNGVMLSDINTVWTADLKNDFPYAVMLFDDTYYGLIVSSKPFFVKENVGVTGYDGERWSYRLYSYLDETQAVGNGLDPGWYYIAGVTTTNQDTNYDKNSLVWANHDILDTDGSIYLHASDPIPLDGMNVITWDGVTDGLISAATFYYKVSDRVFTVEELIGSVLVLSVDAVNETFVDIPPSEFRPAVDGTGVLLAEFLLSADAGTIDFGYGSAEIPESGTYLGWGSVDAHVSLFAYPASSELPPDEGSGNIDFTGASLHVVDVERSFDTLFYEVSWSDLPVVPYPDNVQYFIRATLSDGSPTQSIYIGSSSDPPSGSVPVFFEFEDLSPSTEYIATFELAYNTSASTNGPFTSSGVTLSDTSSTTSDTDISDGNKAIINAIDNANKDNQQWLNNQYNEAVGDLPEDTASTDAMIGDLDLKEEAYKNDAFARFQELSTAFTGFDGDIASGIGLAGTLFSRFFNALGTYKIIYTFPLLLGLALVIIGRLGRSGGPRSGRDSDVPGQFKMDGW